MSAEDEADWAYYVDRVAEDAAAERARAAEEAEGREAIAKLDGGFKHEGEFVTPPQASSVQGPWDLFSTTVPFMSYIKLVWNWRRYYRSRQDIAYMARLLDTKGEVESVVFERAAEVLRDARGEQIRHNVRVWYQRLRYQRWPAFRKAVGF